MPTVLLIRHGENDYVTQRRLAGRLARVHLNDKGRVQAKALAEKLAKMPIKAVYSSPLERTMETAEPIAHKLGLEVILRPGLNEIDFGTWQGKTLKQLGRRKLWRVVQFSPAQAQFPEGESFAQAQLRITHELQDLCSQHKPRATIICVSHSDAIKLAVAYFIGMPLDLFQRLIVAPASITTLHISPSGARLINLNHTLSPPQPHP